MYFRSSSTPSSSPSRGAAASSTNITATCSIRSSGKRSRPWYAPASRRTCSPTPRSCASGGRSRGRRRGVHGLPLREVEPALGDAVDDPDAIGREDDEADQDQAKDAADDAP